MKNDNLSQTFSNSPFSVRTEYGRLRQRFYQGGYWGNYEDSLAAYCCENFKLIPLAVRKTCLDMNDFDKTYHFDSFGRGENSKLDRAQLLRFCEYIYNLLHWCIIDKLGVDKGHRASAVALLEQIKLIVDSLGLMKVIQNGVTVFVQRSASAAVVSKIVSCELETDVLRYGHHSLNGDVRAKKEILRRLGDDLEPKRSRLQSTDGQLANAIFFLLNNLNIRHNNTDPAGKSYQPHTATMTKTELEKFYDDLYYLFLQAFLALDNLPRRKRITDLVKCFKQP